MEGSDDNKQPPSPPPRLSADEESQGSVSAASRLLPNEGSQRSQGSKEQKSPRTSSAPPSSKRATDANAAAAADDRSQCSNRSGSIQQPLPPQLRAPASGGGPPPKNVEVDSRRGNVADSSVVSTNNMSFSDGNRNSTQDEWVKINDDVYNMFFLSKTCGQCLWYALYIFLFKLTLYTFLITDAIELEQPDDVSVEIYVTQFFMLPVAVSIQEDLIATYFLLANIKYSPLIKMNNPEAAKWKFHVANICRGIDGLFSLLVNFVILMKATEVRSLFLNFAALQFLQTIDNVALRLCADGYLSASLEEAAERVKATKLPNKTNEVARSMDSILFLSTLSSLIIAWAIISFL